MYELLGLRLYFFAGLVCLFLALSRSCCLRLLLIVCIFEIEVFLLFVAQFTEAGKSRDQNRDDTVGVTRSRGHRVESRTLFKISTSIGLAK